MPPLSNLPDELLLQVISYLRPIDIENLAKTLKKTLTHICLPFLDARLANRRNALRMISLFGPSRLPVSAGGSTLFSDNFEPDEALRWLEDLEDVPLDPEQRKYANECNEKTIEELTARLQRLGVQLPLSFVRLAKNAMLQEKLMDSNEGYWQFRDIIWKLRILKPGSPSQNCDDIGNKAVDASACSAGHLMSEGYLLPFGWDQQQPVVYNCLFLEASSDAGHCVLKTAIDVDPPEHAGAFVNGFPNRTHHPDETAAGMIIDTSANQLTELEQELGVKLPPWQPPWSDQQRVLYRLASPSFEQDLLKLWFSQLAWRHKRRRQGW